MLENDCFYSSMNAIDHSNPLIVHNKNKFKVFDKQPENNVLGYLKDET